MNRFSEEMKIIPRGAWIIAFVICFGLPLLACVYLLSRPHGEVFSRFEVPLLFLLPVFFLFFFYIVLLGYITGDSRRRGMRPVPWVLLAMFIPNMIGFILYFILRGPLLRGCPQCGASSAATFAFCPSCGATLSDACPSCRNAIEPGWSHCPKCGSTLRTV